MKRILFVLAYAFSNFLYAQNVDEYLITNSGDTLRGEIEVISSNKRISAIEFIKKGTNETQRYRADQIRSFFDVKYGLHESYLIDAGNFYIGNELRDSVNTIEFLEVLARGKVSLFPLKRGVNFLFNSKMVSWSKLLYQERKILIDENNKIVKEPTVYTKVRIVKDEGFKGQLAGYMTPDCKEIYKYIRSVELTSTSLLKLFSKYFSCGKQMNSSVTYEQTKRGGKANFGILLGFASTKASIVSNGYYANPVFLNQEFTASNTLVPGVYMDYYISSRNQRLSLLCELLYKETKTTSSLEYSFKTTAIKFNTPI